MSVVDKSKIDFIGIDKETNNVILTITDHLSWVDEMSHIYILQEKINSYIAFIEGNELHETYPESLNKTILINIVFKYKITLLCAEFLNKVKGVLYDLDVKLTYDQP